MLRITKSVQPIEVRFFAKVEKTASCWIWTGCRNADGYGMFMVGGKGRGAHRVSWELQHGPIPEGKQLDHLCRNRACVNPAHLEPVTQIENVRRGDLGATTAARQRAKTACPRGHEYTPENTRLQGDWRSCKTCERERNRRKRSEARRPTSC